MLALRAGRYPTAAGEAAVTDAVAEEFALEVGAPVALDGTTRTVVVVVENPGDLSDEFVLLPPGSDAAQDTVTVLVDASSEQVMGFWPPGGGGLEIGDRGSANEGVFAAVGVFGVATVALVLVALLAAAGFVAVAQRRLRQLGMLAAIGATGRHLRLTMVANGAAVGVVGTLAGAALGLLGWIGVEPRLETAVATASTGSTCRGGSSSPACCWRCSPPPPVLSYRHARGAIDFLAKAFGFEERSAYAREGDPSIIEHAEMRGAARRRRDVRHRREGQLAVRSLHPGQRLGVGRVRRPRRPVRPGGGRRRRGGS